MKIFDILGFCFKNLARRKLRTFLTITGIVLGTCSIVLTFAFSYTITKNIEETMKEGGDINKITILRQEYNPNKNKNKKNKRNFGEKRGIWEQDEDLDFGDALVKKLSEVKGVDFVFPEKTLDLYAKAACFVGNEYFLLDLNVVGVDFSRPKNLERMGYHLLPGGEFKKSKKNSKQKNVVAGAMVPYSFFYLKGKSWEEAYRSPYSVIYGGQKDVAPFFDMNKEKLKLTILSQQGQKQFGKIVETFQKNIYGSSTENNFEDDDEGDEEYEDVSSHCNLENLAGKKFDFKITGYVTLGGFDIGKRDWELIKKYYENSEYDEINKLGCVYLDINTAKELEKVANDLNKDVSSSADRAKNNKFAYSKITIMAKDWEEVGKVVDYVQGVMNYRTESLLGNIKERQKQSAGIRFMLLALGVITVIVSALGIANMMFMSISERTKEIGVMKVLGCRLRNIREMFLAEAGVVGFLGGLIGVGSSYGIAKGLSAVVRKVGTEEFLAKAAESEFLTNMLEAVNNFANMFDVVEGKDIISIPVYLAIGGVLFGVLVGLLSGLAPANRAVRISALSAIKDE